MHRTHKTGNWNFQDWHYLPIDLNVADHCRKSVRLGR